MKFRYILNKKLKSFYWTDLNILNKNGTERIIFYLYNI